MTNYQKAGWLVHHCQPRPAGVASPVQQPVALPSCPYHSHLVLEICVRRRAETEGRGLRDAGAHHHGCLYRNGHCTSLRFTVCLHWYTVGKPWHHAIITSLKLIWIKLMRGMIRVFVLNNWLADRGILFCASAQGSAWPLIKQVESALATGILSLLLPGDCSDAQTLIN